jgi:hypothetical protein
MRFEPTTPVFERTKTVHAVEIEILLVLILFINCLVSEILAQRFIKKKNSVTSVREGTIPTERPQLVGEVNDNYWEYIVSRGQHDGSLWPYSRFLDRSAAFTCK